MTCSAILLAAGKSSRMPTDIDKLQLSVGGLPLLAHSLKLFEESPLIDELILVTDTSELAALGKLYAPCKLKKIVSGGATRMLSVQNGLLAADGDLICIHDGARANLAHKQLSEVIMAAKLHGAAILGCPVTDTIKVVEQGIIRQTPERSTLYAAQTPQVFKREILLKAYENADAYATDDAQLVQQAGFEITIVQGEKSNLKLTTETDILLLRALMEPRGIRTGNGFDVHRLVENRKLILGGVEIPFEKGLLGHSDADVLLHAVCDALLGAASLSDIGRCFPDNDEKFKDISSVRLLSAVACRLQQAGYRVINIDATLIAEMPKIAPYVLQMRQNIADALGIGLETVSVKATTTEGLGYIGEGQAMASLATCNICG